MENWRTLREVLQDWTHLCKRTDYGVLSMHQGHERLIVAKKMAQQVPPTPERTPKPPLQSCSAQGA